jgi:hypothetical protein
MNLLLKDLMEGLTHTARSDLERARIAQEVWPTYLEDVKAIRQCLKEKPLLPGSNFESEVLRAVMRDPRYLEYDKRVCKLLETEYAGTEVRELNEIPALMDEFQRTAGRRRQ